MRLKGHDYYLQQSLKQVCLRKSPQSHQSLSRYRGYASNSSSPPQDIAILGGGITGLSTAYYLSRGQNAPRVTIYEKSPRLGGWLSSKTVDVEGGKVLFEQGPRTFRPSMPRGANAAALLEEVGLADDIIFVPKDSPSAQLRWLFYPDHLFCLPVPSEGILAALPKFLNEPALKGVIWGIITEVFKDTRSEDIMDESVGAFLSRRINAPFVENVVSAVFHGVYAGDVWQLSAKSLMPHQWHVEKEDSSVILGIPHLMEMIQEDDLNLIKHLAEAKQPSQEIVRKLRESSVFTLKRGLSQLTERLESLLKMGGNVTFRPETAVKEVVMQKDPQKIKVITESEETSGVHDQVISTLFSKSLSQLCTSPSTSSTPGRPLLPSLASTHAVNVNVVNLYYSDSSLLPIQGFGYLLPQSVPFEQNPERALGVIFDSEVAKGQDTVDGTKLTIMLGGHWWDGWSAIPNEQESIDAAKSLVKRHLGISAEPTATCFSSQRDCIPQYTVGHSQRLKDAHRALLQGYQGRLKVAGNSYTGVGVNDCLKAALEVAQSALSREWSQKTGLESFENDIKYISKKEAGRGLYAGTEQDLDEKLSDLKKRVDGTNKRALEDGLKKLEGMTSESRATVDELMREVDELVDKGQMIPEEKMEVLRRRIKDEKKRLEQLEEENAQQTKRIEVAVGEERMRQMREKAAKRWKK